MNQMEANNHTACHMCVCWNLFECDKCINAWKEKDSAWRSWFTIECDPFIKWYKIQFSFSINILIKFNHDLLYSLCEMPMVATEFPSFPFPLMCNELHQFQTIETTRTDHWLSFLIVHDARLYTLAKKKKKTNCRHNCVYSWANSSQHPHPTQSMLSTSHQLDSIQFNYCCVHFFSVQQHVSPDPQNCLFIYIFYSEIDSKLMNSICRHIWMDEKYFPKQMI